MSNGVKKITEFSIWDSAVIMRHAAENIKGNEDEILQGFYGKSGVKQELGAVYVAARLFPEQRGAFFHEDDDVARLHVVVG